MKNIDDSANKVNQMLDTIPSTLHILTYLFLTEILQDTGCFYPSSFDFLKNRWRAEAEGS